MNAAKSTTSTVPGYRRLSPRQTADALGITVDQVMLVSAKGGRYFDPSFPQRVGGTFAEVEVMALKKAHGDGAKQDTSPTASPPVATTNPPSNRPIADRRTPHV